jgi:L-methionine (R)-S-oxide reductase
LKKEDAYKASLREIAVRLEKGGDIVADLGNAAAVLKKRLKFYWAGFYMVRDDRKLVLGPFQGAPACVFLAPGRGVCAAAVSGKKTIVVPDVHEFEGHIACDPNSRSEIAVPVFDGKGVVRAVLDVDSDRLNAFDETDRRGLEGAAGLLENCWD